MFQAAAVQDSARGCPAQHVCEWCSGGGSQEHRGSLWNTLQGYVQFTQV